MFNTTYSRWQILKIILHLKTYPSWLTNLTNFFLSLVIVSRVLLSGTTIKFSKLLASHFSYFPTVNKWIKQRILRDNC